MIRQADPTLRVFRSQTIQSSSVQSDSSLFTIETIYTITIYLQTIYTFEKSLIKQCFFYFYIRNMGKSNKIKIKENGFMNF